MANINDAVYPSLQQYSQAHYTPQTKVPVPMGFQGASASSGSLRTVAVPSFGYDASQMLTRGMTPQQSGVLGYFFLSTAYPGSNGACSMASKPCNR
jgi:hypothetical protein